jgi:hypothetical protein
VEGLLLQIGECKLEIGEWRISLTRIHPWESYPICMELIFEVRDADEDGCFARALGHAIFTEGDTWDELRANVLEATSFHFEDEAVQRRLVQLHYVKDELIPVQAA